MRIALIGYGLAGRVFHAPLIAATEGLELAAIVTADEGRLLDLRELLTERAAARRPGL